MRNKLKSRKLWLAVIGAAITIANEQLGMNLPKEAILTVAGLFIAYILGESYVDAQNKPSE